MARVLFVYLLYFFMFSIRFGESIRWLSLQHSHFQWNISTLNSNLGRGIGSGSKSICTIARRRYGFEKIQAKLCRRSMEIMPHIQTAATLASETCRSVFKHRRWNCSSILTAPYLTPDLTRSTREQAYVYAISSAALIYTMARGCSSGTLHQCTCANKATAVPVGDFQWGGCSDNVKWGIQFARRFIDNVEKSALVTRNKRNEKEGKMQNGAETAGVERSSIAAVNLHNNKVGRKIMSGSLRTQCKCHGVSGSCNIKTCWNALPPMSEIGVRLLEQYTNALMVIGNVIDSTGSVEILPKSRKKFSSTQLVYISKSPDYCTRDERLGSFGTVGRYCNVSSIGPESCRQLCCGRGYRTVVEEKIERCQCKFYNCCYVKCKICRTKTKVYECL
ncbi:protein Wnt-11b-1-like isoform X1 [Diorhabda sublineata]|uniref:protein Wnt-11b-1-like isoform X1 n=1 Tax=Diorhabda sublineata TaxID=1163346 RepID=UPI0024E1795B|nr:protein Wnt-11b-1-like isoform X1 [Diorhabda sublineata]